MSDHHAHESLDRTALMATLHCLTGCAIGEILGMVLATAFGLSNALSIALSVVLAFVFGYGLTLRPLLRTVPVRRAARLALASDTLSITTMEIVDNAFIALVPGALAAGLTDSLFWWSLGVSLGVAFLADEGAVAHAKQEPPVAAAAAVREEQRAGHDADAAIDGAPGELRRITAGG